MRYIKELSESEQKELQRIVKESQLYRERQRAQAILFSFQSYSITELAELFQVDRDTISAWFNRFEKSRISGLSDAQGRGRKPKLNNSEKKT